MRKKYSRFYIRMRGFFSRNFDIRQEKEEEVDTIESIKKGIEFKGTNLWVLIFAVFIASLGLNINSTAVIIGAMLISPLMGPIMGFGLGLGINDFELLKRSLKNFGIATLFSVVSSTVYFLISPFSEAQSELLARTQPTIYDVLIAFFGGLAGIVAGSSKSKGNVIPGVAIATALMPPLCTAGFGIATGNIQYFFGAFYLYFINSVFISLSTYLVIRVLGYEKKTFINKEREKKVTRYITLIVIFTIVPSAYLTYNMLKQNFFETSANHYINKELSFPGTQILSKDIKYTPKKRAVEVVMIGQQIHDDAIEMAKNKLTDYQLFNTELVVKQGIGEKNMDINTLKTMVLQDFYMNTKETVEAQAITIDSLRNQIVALEKYNKLNKELIPEIKALFPKIKEAFVTQVNMANMDFDKSDSTTLVYLKVDGKMSKKEKESFEEWISARTKTTPIRLVIEEQ